MWTTEQTAHLVTAAIRAPSSHNTQPWVFRDRDGALELLADRTRALPVNDPEDRELLISCGAALFNLRVAAAELGLGLSIARFPDSDDPDLLARIRPDAAIAVEPLVDLASAIPQRRTWRQAFAVAPVPPEAVAELTRAAADAGARLQVVDAARDAVADLVAEADALQWADRRWRRELAQWMHPRRQGDGLAMPGLLVPVAQAVVRTFDLGGGVAAKDRELAEHSPLLTVLLTPSDTPADWLAAGEALQHALLVGVRAGLQASYLNQPVEMEATRARLAALSGAEGVAQLLLRWGFAEVAVPAAPRRPLEAVLLSDGSA